MSSELAGAGPGQGPLSARRTVLVIDDHPGIRTVTGQALERLGFAPLIAFDGASGVDLFERHLSEISCVMLDIAMPGMGGRAVFTAIREQAPELPIVIMSGHSDAQHADWLLGDGHATFIRKPFGLALLRDTLERAIHAEG